MKTYFSYIIEKYLIDLIILNFMIFPFLIKICLSSECPHYSLPIKKDNVCIAGGCTSEEFNDNNCTIQNDIIKVQWLTSVIIFSESNSYYITLATTPNGDLICISNAYEKTKKYFYGLKSNGRPYFQKDNVETPFNENDCRTFRYEGNIYAIKLEGKEKEYIVSFGANYAYFEIYDFDNDIVYKEEGNTFFDTNFNTFRYASIFKLTNDINYYIISFIAQVSTSSYCCSKNFFIIRYLFSNLNINTNRPTKKVQTLDAGEALSSSCFESTSKYGIFIIFTLSMLFLRGQGKIGI